MKTRYSLLALLFFCLLSQFSNGQQKAASALIFGNQQYLNRTNTYDLAFENSLFVQQNNPWNPHNEARKKMVESELNFYRQLSATSIPSTGLDYDVKYHRLELRINPDTSIGKYIKGKVTTYFTTTISNFSLLQFDFATPLTCDSVYYHGVKLSAGNIIRPIDLIEISLPVISSIGTLDSVAIYYQGVPPTVPGFSNGTGYVNAKHNGSQNYTYTLSEPYSAYTWWPCKSFVVNDKADSLDVIVSTPVGFKTAGNGTLISETTVGSNVITYWKHRYPISAYQVCTSVANFVQYPAVPTIVNIGGTPMPYYNYLFPETNTVAAHGALDKTALMLTTFSSKFGDYPFKNEKYGHYSFGFGGGMEHNTFSGMHPGTYDQTGDWDIIAHELGHQWFGANVTCGSWREIWINESFATFAEAICAEFAPSVSSGQTGASWRGYHKSQAIYSGNQSQSIYVSDTSSIYSIFTPAVYVYERGAMVIYMLRTLLGDAKFFQAIQNYQYDPLLKNGNAVTADVQRHMEAVSGLDLSSFFNQWIYNTGFANYNSAGWNNAGTKIVLQLPQTTQYSALSHFDMPVAVRIQGGVGDTTIIVYDKGGVIYYDDNGVLSSSGSNIVQYDLSFVPTTVTFDAFNQVLANGSFTKNPGLSTLSSNFVKFSGNKKKLDVNLWWNVDNTIDLFSFDVERSIDGIAFETIGKIGAQLTPAQTNFSFIDRNCPMQDSYYRIKLNQKKGNSIYTKTIVINNSAANNYSVTPNPASDFFILKAMKSVSRINVKIYDGSGKLMRQLTNKKFDSNSSLQVSVSDMVAGNYYVEIQDVATGNSTTKIVIIK
ncbi:MAG: M1 family aminopeptidase [Ferruginibacter sp.]